MLESPMFGRSQAAAAKAVVALAFLIAVSVLPGSADAQSAGLNNVCGTAEGNCISQSRPVGTPCGCATKSNQMVPGQILPPSGGGVPQQVQATSDTCRTSRGICQTYQAPIGSPCGCFGDPGNVIPR
jgi:hypothetical protein